MLLSMEIVHQPHFGLCRFLVIVNEKIVGWKRDLIAELNYKFQNFLIRV